MPEAFTDDAVTLTESPAAGTKVVLVPDQVPALLLRLMVLCSPEVVSVMVD